MWVATVASMKVLAHELTFVHDFWLQYYHQALAFISILICPCLFKNIIANKDCSRFKSPFWMITETALQNDTKLVLVPVIESVDNIIIIVLILQSWEHEPQKPRVTFFVYIDTNMKPQGSTRNKHEKKSKHETNTKNWKIYTAFTTAFSSFAHSFCWH